MPTELSRRRHLTETGSKVKQEAIDILLALDPERLAIVVRMLERYEDGMPIDEAVGLAWEEMADAGLLPDGAVFRLAAEQFKAKPV